LDPRNFILILLQATCLFLAAGSLLWLSARVYVGVITLNQAAVWLALLRTSPELSGESTGMHIFAQEVRLWLVSEIW